MVARTLNLFVAMALVACAVSSVSADEQSGGRPPGAGGRPSFEKLLDAFDGDDSGDLDRSEVPPPVWRRLSAADANGDEVVTGEEFHAVGNPGRRGDRTSRFAG